MNKVTIKLLGGIGNNLFQIACAYSYSLKTNKELILINEKFGATHNSLNTYKDNILRKINFVDKYDVSKFKVYTESGFEYNEIPYIDGDICLNGYFQSELYFKEYKKEIRDLFSYPDNYVAEVKEQYGDLLLQNTCSIHVRRGDYLNLPNHHPTQNMNYYMKAIKNIGIDKTYVFFSDDIIWCKEQFSSLPNVIFIENQEDHSDLLLMSMMCNNIIANSTFSWWGAWLNNNPEKIIISPSSNNWFGPAMNNNTKDIIPENWIKI